MVRIRPGFASSVVRRVVDLVWPRMGWRRQTRYLRHRVARLPGTPYSIAAGFACGAAISFTPFIGCHFILSALLAWVIGGSIIASAFGTIVGNPWTFPFIWLSTYRVGNAVLGAAGGETAPGALSLDLLLSQPGQVLLPMTVGGAALGAVAWTIFFFPLKRAICAYRMGRLRKAKGIAIAAGREIKI